jgi:hypothetical protein
VWQAAVRGDIYLNEGVHTALCQDGGNDGVFGVDMLSEFNRSEDPNDRYHGKSGDQDGYESVIRTYYDDHWDIILHYVGGLIEDLMWDGEKGEPEKDDSKEDGGMIVPKFVIFDDDPTEHITEDGIHAHPIANADEKKAVILWWDKVNGIKLDPNPIHFGSKDAPWGARYNDVMSRGANFKTFEKFNKHPSTRAVMRDENARQTAEILKGIEAALS